jgi:SAM-dependent methyltransferase
MLFSRFGVMFFADPIAAFANLRRALRPGGRLAFVCWQAVTENPWMLVPLGAALQILPPPPLPGPEAPGPFAFADPDRVRRILTGAGFQNPELEPVVETLRLGGGGGLDTTVDFLLQMGPTAAALRGVARSDAGPARDCRRCARRWRPTSPTTACACRRRAGSSRREI